MDIEVFVRDRCDKLIREGKLRVESDLLEQKIATTLISKTQGMFLWVDLQLAALLHERREFEIEIALQELRKGLNETYQRSFQRIKEYESPRLQALARKCLLWVFYAARPLQLEELLEESSIDKDWLTRADVEQREWKKEDVLEACANLLSMEESVVQPIHYTVQEFFTSLNNPNHISTNPRTILDDTRSPDTAYVELSMACLHYLMFLDSLRPRWSMSDRDFARNNPLAYHSARWFDHYIQKLRRIPHEVKNTLEEILFTEPISLNMLLILRNISDGIQNRYGGEEVVFEDLIYATVLYNIKDLFSKDSKWYRIKIPKLALHHAAGNGNIAAITQLLEARVPVSGKDEGEVTALYYASENGHLTVVEHLLENQTDGNAQGGDYDNTLQVAPQGGHEAVVKLLLRAGADINAQGGYYGNALLAASYQGYVAVVKLLLGEGVDVNSNTHKYWGNTLQAASHKRQAAVLGLLLDEGADINAQGGYYGNALQVACVSHYFEGGTRGVKLLLNGKADVNARGGRHGNALAAASFSGNKAVVQLLLDEGDVFNDGGEIKDNPFYAAASRGDKEMVKFLLSNGVEFDAERFFTRLKEAGREDKAQRPLDLVFKYREGERHRPSAQLLA